MKIKTVGLAAIAGSVLLFLALPGSAQEVSVEYTGGYSTTFSNTDGDFGAGVYTATINGAPSPGIVCDDYSDEITSGETWNANAYQASSLTSTNIGETLFGSTIGLTGYAEVATLVSMMFGNIPNSYGGITGITQSELSSAIWDITTPGGINGLDAKAQALVSALEGAFGGNLSAAETYLATLSNLWILTPTPTGPGEAQEMWTENLAVPEGGAASMFLLLAGASCFGAMFLRSRNRKLRDGLISTPLPL